MTVMSAPFWIIISFIALATYGLPSSNQFVQVIIVTIFSSIIATILFFKATNMERDNPTGLALVESTIAAQVPLSLITGVLILGDRIPSGIGLIGILFIIIGIILSTIIKDSSEKNKSKNL
ncbi:MAG: multidrug resistance efflux transporter family protein, partial [Patescibacteria group bacterium]